MRRHWNAGLVLGLLACAIAAASWWDARRRLGELRSRFVEQETPAETAWLNGTTGEKFRQVEGQLRGFDKTMVEVGYRFTELYFAGKDRNWDYADYQAEKIDAAIRLGLERRPKRAASARYFLEEDFPAMRAVLKRRDGAQFEKAVVSLRQACMRCHVRESVPHFAVQLPERRLSPIRRRPQ